MISKTSKTIGAACIVATALAVAMVPAAGAKGGDGLRVAGTCSDASTSKLKVKHDDGRIQVEFEVDQNRSGARWSVQLRRDGRLVFQGARRTVAPSGSFSVERRIANGTATATIHARATRSGEVCTATARLSGTATAVTTAATTTTGTSADAARASSRHGDDTNDDHGHHGDDANDDHGRHGNDD